METPSGILTGIPPVVLSAISARTSEKQSVKRIAEKNFWNSRWNPWITKGVFGEISGEIPEKMSGFSRKKISESIPKGVYEQIFQLTKRGIVSRIVRWTSGGIAERISGGFLKKFLKVCLEKLLRNPLIEFVKELIEKKQSLFMVAL